MRYQFIRVHQTAHRVSRLCQVLGVSRSGYYAWCMRPVSCRVHQNQQLLTQIRQMHIQTKGRYGAVKLWQALRATGVTVGRHRVARLRRQVGLEANRTRRFRVYVEHHQWAPPAPNRLQQTFVAPHPNQVWAGDLTMIPTRAGKVYLAVVLDLYSRRVVGWAMSPKPEKQVAITALQMALSQRRPQPGLIHHTDRGAQYVSIAYRQLLQAAGLIASMSRRGNCYDNAVVESFFSTLKNELLHDRDYHSRDEVQADVFEFIEVFYNRQRLHQTLGYVSPVQFEATNLVPIRSCLRNRG